jgi:hypothetical protein
VRRDDARKLLANGVAPSVHRQATKLAQAKCSANLFEVIGREWFAKQFAKITLVGTTSTLAFTDFLIVD